MKIKKILAGAMVGAMVLTAVPVVSLVTPTTASTAYAAKGGARLGGGGMKAPKASTPAPKATTPDSGSKSVSGNGNGYQPSKNAKDLQKDAPAANSRSNANANAAKTQQSGSRWGSALRNIGLLAGGMFLGSMLANALGGLGLGTGLLGDILGLAFNVIMLLVVLMAVRWLWNKFRGNKNNRNGGSGSSFGGNRNLDMRGNSPAGNRQHLSLHDDAQQGDSAKTIADRYRNR